MKELAEAIKAGMEREPGDFDGREALWMEREDLRALLRRAVATLETKMVGACGTLLTLLATVPV